MSDILFNCPSCTKRLVAPGKTCPATLTCPGCGKTARVPPPAIYFNCRTCRWGLWASAEVRGKEATCPKCLTKMTIPLNTKITCPNCSSRLDVQDQPLTELVGQTATCPECRGDIPIPPLPVYTTARGGPSLSGQLMRVLKLAAAALVTIVVVLAGFYLIGSRTPSRPQEPQPVKTVVDDQSTNALVKTEAPAVEPSAPAPAATPDDHVTPAPPPPRPANRRAGTKPIDKGPSLPPPKLDEEPAPSARPTVAGSGQLMTAAQDGDIPALSATIEGGANINSRRDGDGATVLHIAVGSGNIDLVRWLVDHGADVNAELAEKLDTPLHMAVDTRSVEITQLLLDKKANANARTARGYTPLMRGPGGKITALLLGAGADAKARADDGYTPLHFATDAESARLLLQKGADPRAKANDGSSPLDLAREASSKFGESEVFRILTVAK